MKQISIALAALTATWAGGALAQQPVAEPAVGTANDKTLIQRGEDFVPAAKDMKFEPGDRIVILNDGRMEVNCGGQKVAVYDVPGVFDVPGCPGAPVVAQAPAPAAQPPAATPAPAPSAPARTASTGGSGGSVGAVLGGLLLAAAAAGGGGGGGGGDGPSSP